MVAGLHAPMSTRRLVALATHDAQQGQQALEHIDDVQIKGQCGADVVGFATVDNAFEVIQHVGTEDSDGGHRDRHHAGGGADKHIDDATDHDGQRTHKQPLTASGP